MRLVQSIIYDLCEGAMGLVVTWQELWIRMLVGLGFGMVNYFGLAIGTAIWQRATGVISSNLGVYRYLQMN